MLEAAAARRLRIPNTCDLRVYGVTDPACNAQWGRSNAGERRVGFGLEAWDRAGCGCDEGGGRRRAGAAGAQPAGSSSGTSGHSGTVRTKGSLQILALGRPTTTPD